MTAQKSAAAVGIDIGSTTAKAVALNAAGQVVWTFLEQTDPHISEQAAKLFAAAAQDSQNPPSLVATGYGRKLVSAAQHRVTEISCHARGVFAQNPQAQTLIDIGGQDSKVIVIDAKGAVQNFVMNDKCAAGSGRFLEVAAQRLKLSMEQMGQLGAEIGTEVAISSTCTVFADSEIISRIALGDSVEDIVRGLHRSLVKRVASLVYSARPDPPFTMSGGLAQSPAIVAMLSEQLGQPITVAKDPQLIGALGAAWIALDRI